MFQIQWYLFPLLTRLVSGVSYKANVFTMTLIVQFILRLFTKYNAYILVTVREKWYLLEFYNKNSTRREKLR